MGEQFQRAGVGDRRPAGIEFGAQAFGLDFQVF
jgi:hypothetical protein